MSGKQRAAGPWAGIFSLALSVGCWVMCLRARYEPPPPHAEGPEELFVIIPLAVLLHMVALVTIGVGPKWNRVLGATAVISFWACFRLVMMN